MSHSARSSWPSAVSLFDRHISTGFTSLNLNTKNRKYSTLTFLSAEHLANAARNSLGSGLPIVLWFGSGLDVSDGMNFDLSNPGSSEIKLDVFEFVDNDDFEMVICIYWRITLSIWFRKLSYTGEIHKYKSVSNQTVQMHEIHVENSWCNPSFTVFLTRWFLKLFLGLLIHFSLNLNFCFLCFSKIFEYAIDFLFNFRMIIASRTPSIIIGMNKTAAW